MTTFMEFLKNKLCMLGKNSRELLVTFASAIREQKSLLKLQHERVF